MIYTTTTDSRHPTRRSRGRPLLRRPRSPRHAGWNKDERDAFDAFVDPLIRQAVSRHEYLRDRDLRRKQHEISELKKRLMSAADESATRTRKLIEMTKEELEETAGAMVRARLALTATRILISVRCAVATTLGACVPTLRPTAPMVTVIASIT